MTDHEVTIDFTGVTDIQAAIDAYIQKSIANLKQRYQQAARRSMMIVRPMYQYQEDTRHLKDTGQVIDTSTGPDQIQIDVLW